MTLTEKNLREKEFHNKLQSKKKVDLKQYFIKQFTILMRIILNIFNNSSNSEVLDYGCGIGTSVERVAKNNPKKIVGIIYQKYRLTKQKRRLTNSI